MKYIMNCLGGSYQILNFIKTSLISALLRLLLFKNTANRRRTLHALTFRVGRWFWYTARTGSVHKPQFNLTERSYDITAFSVRK